MLHVVLDFLIVEMSTNQPLESKHSVLRIDDGLSLSRKADETLAVFCERDDGGCRPCAFRVLNDARALALHDRDARVCRTQVDTDNRTYERSEYLRGM